MVVPRQDDPVPVSVPCLVDLYDGVGVEVLPLSKARSLGAVSQSNEHFFEMVITCIKVFLTSFGRPQFFECSKHTAS